MVPGVTSGLKRSVILLGCSCDTVRLQGVETVAVANKACCGVSAGLRPVCRSSSQTAEDVQSLEESLR